MNRLAVVTSGGDAPGMNAAVRAVTRIALGAGVEVLGVHHGYQGLIDGHFEHLSSLSVSDIIHRGGTILGTARSEHFKSAAGLQRAADNLKARTVDGLVVIGGDGSLAGSHDLHARGKFPVNHVPSSIDGDLAGTDHSIGFDSAVNTAIEAIDRIRDTAESLDRVFVVEVMGRDHGFLALQTGLAAGAEEILVPEIPWDLQAISRDLLASAERGKRSFIIVVAEGAASATEIAPTIQGLTHFETRHAVLGHIQRGGSPSAFDRALATRLGAAAARLLLEGVSGVMVGDSAESIIHASLAEVVARAKPFDTERHRLARQVSR